MDTTSSQLFSKVTVQSTTRLHTRSGGTVCRHRLACQYQRYNYINFYSGRILPILCWLGWYIEKDVGYQKIQRFVREIIAV
jgi:hypothetical protein